jgi:1-acyl-sn-glycerol-3-phosphate acyltransferase
MLMLAIIKNHLFCRKQELAKIPLFGFSINVLVFSDRGNSKNRMEVLTRLKKINRGLSVCIFPEGVPDDESFF